MKIKINKKISINSKKPPLIIAEISGNHCGKKSIFLSHIRSAAKNGADLIKIQTYEPEDITLENNIYKIKSGIWKSKTLWSIYKKLVHLLHGIRMRSTWQKKLESRFLAHLLV